ncbi:hypothetical protein [Saccharothrix variisporea]|uniref:Anti-sigma factor n=1 Tax=Saccharothrix variisporea TaxID=543527 RepID=A0A495XMD4_9PSEU|nr:hypothetical protein [Saccharothrix variisporea]RKT73613.1 hypothetical protein DFJ66_6950 [Saccharothrix variisporea]
MHDPILERTLRRVRAESARAHRRRGGVAAAVSATVLAGVLVCGVQWGHRSVPGEQLVTAASGEIHMTATVSPADGWVRLHATVAGLRPDERCQLVVTDSRGRRFVAGGWVATRGDDTTLSGAALVASSDIAAISVITPDGQVLISATP